MKWLAVALGVISSGCALRLNTPTLHATAGAAVVSDCASTMALVPRADFEETNPLLGKEPMPSDIVGWCLLGLGATQGMALLLPDPWRRGWLTWVTVMELTVFVHNMHWVWGP